MKTIGIIGAMDEELVLIKADMNIEKTVEKAKTTFFVGTIGDKNVVVVRCGIGKVNAAMCTQILIDDFSVDAVINTGVAGAVADGITVGDVIISKDALQHDMDCSPLGDPAGVIPRMNESIFKAADSLINVAKAASEKVISGKTAIGRVVSGDQFIASSETKVKLRDVFGGSCAEMEGAAIAHICYMNAVPFVVIRNISDSADGNADVSYAEFCVTAADHSGRIVLEMLKNI
ncbi:MAG: 5'-methylthioadenosine/adenosylhomocysteine nucleosidase [Clostridiales bacterium]|nr:5'-methylthioadenosine/adenosylhomocysteine nucleosidase [Clostridiales bacterium]